MLINNEYIILDMIAFEIYTMIFIVNLFKNADTPINF